MQMWIGFFYELQDWSNAGTLRLAQNKDREQTSAPVLAAFSTTSTSWLAGMCPMDWAPTFTYCLGFGISDNTAFVQRGLVGLGIESPNLWNPSCNCCLEWREREWLGRLGGKIDLGVWENLKGMFVEKTRDLPILKMKVLVVLPSFVWLWGS
jgi:hypothetical protein